MTRTALLAPAVLLALALPAEAAYSVRLNVATSSVELDLPPAATVTAGDSFDFDLLLVGANNLGFYNFVLTLSSSDAADVLGSDFSIDLVDRSGDPRYVFAGLTTTGPFFSSATDTGNTRSITLGDYADVGVNTVEGVNDLVASFHVTTGTNFRGTLNIGLGSDDASFDFALLVSPFDADNAFAPVSGFTDLQQAVQLYDTALPDSSPIVVDVTPNSSTPDPNVVPAPPGLVLALAGIVPLAGCGWWRRRADRRSPAASTG